MRFFFLGRKSNLMCGRAATMQGTLLSVLLTASAGAGLFSLAARAQQTTEKQNAAKAPVVVQPGAPGEQSKTLPPSTHATLLPRSQANVEFMQGMIMHHAQAVEMTALMESHTENKELRALGARISSSQTDEIKFMKRWLTARGESVSMAMQSTATHAVPHETSHAMPEMATTGAGDISGNRAQHGMGPLMPGMLTAEQMEALQKAKGAKFDHLFLAGMIQHHNGALTMVKDLFDTAGAGQDADVFTFATDVDNGQRAEIRIMQSMQNDFPEEKR